jgi:hypothetical protein
MTLGRPLVSPVLRAPVRGQSIDLAIWLGSLGRLGVFLSFPWPRFYFNLGLQ